MEPAVKYADTPAPQLCAARKQLLADFADGRHPADFLARHTAILDDYFIRCFENSQVGPRMNFHRHPFAVVALGGYGRQEMCAHSDIDLLFLFKKQVPREAEALIREIVYPLWDMGFEVGHATRSIRECLSLAGEDTDVLTSLLDARFLCGMMPLHTQLQEKLAGSLSGRRARSVIAALIQNNINRHQKFGDSANLLEPNLKEGVGGLRDYHTILWIARVTSRIITARDLEYHGHLSHDEYADLQKALGFIWTVRNHLHLITGRKYDQLYLEHQEVIARAMGFVPARGQLEVERFLGRLHGEMEYIKQTNRAFLAEAGYAHGPWLRRRRSGRRSVAPGLAVDRNMLTFAAPEALLTAPDLLLSIFEQSAQLDIPLSLEARRIVKEFIFLVDDTFRRDPDHARAFERILAAGAPGAGVFNEMLHTGFLDRFLPRMGTIIDRIQYDGYHLYPIARHSILTLERVKKIGSRESAEPLCADLYRELGRRKKVLLWAALLHDIGKGEAGGGHSERGADIAADMLSELGYGPDIVEPVAFLVKEHLLLVKTATRRDLNSEETALACARRIGDAQTLSMLYLLSIADSMATGPKAWNDWTASVLRDLFLKVLKILEKGELASQEAMATVENKTRELMDMAGSPAEKEALLEHMKILPPRYCLYMPARQIYDHMTLHRRLKDGDFVWTIAPAANGTARTVTVCAKDRPGLFSKIAGVFTLNSLDILEAEIYTWKNGTALDVFTVSPPADRIYEDEQWEKAARHLRDALSGDLDLAAAIAARPAPLRTEKAFATRPPRVRVDNESSSFFTLVEVFAYDFPGLLFSITDILFRCGLDIWVAKIATKVDQVVDIFYVRTLDGEKVDSPDQAGRIQAMIETMLEQHAANGKQMPEATRTS
ncbi:MAG: [protein-PII] uridylyltransferase [Thermodesulfobacteriota bacterium]